MDPVLIPPQRPKHHSPPSTSASTGSIHPLAANRSRRTPRHPSVAAHPPTATPSRRSQASNHPVFPTDTPRESRPRIDPLRCDRMAPKRPPFPRKLVAPRLPRNPPAHPTDPSPPRTPCAPRRQSLVSLPRVPQELYRRPSQPLGQPRDQTRDTPPAHPRRSEEFPENDPKPRAPRAQPSRRRTRCQRNHPRPDATPDPRSTKLVHHPSHVGLLRRHRFTHRERDPASRHGEHAQSRAAHAPSRTPFAVVHSERDARFATPPCATSGHSRHPGRPLESINRWKQKISNDCSAPSSHRSPARFTSPSGSFPKAFAPPSP